MHNDNKIRPTLLRRRCALGAVALGLASAPLAHAGGTFELGESVQGKWNLQGSVGATMRVQNADKNLLFVGDTPGGTPRSANADDGNQNFGAGELVSSVAKLTGDLSLTRNNYTFFARSTAWYDYTLDHDTVPHGHYGNRYRPNSRLNDSNFAREARFKGIDLLDVWVSGRYTLNQQPLEVKVGRQTVGWGRSMFTRATLASINAYNLPALRRPGFIMQELVRPSNMIHLDYKFTDALQARAFYQLEFRETIVDACGTFFSNLDNTAIGCDGTFLSSVVMPAEDVMASGRYLHRQRDEKPSHHNQYGLKFDYDWEAAGAKVGAYYVNYHHRLPIYSMVKAPVGGDRMDTEYYFMFPDNIKLFGLTGSKAFGATQVAVNLSHIPNFPLQINTSDLTSAAMGVSTPASSHTNRYQAGEKVPGYMEQEVSRAELSFSRPVANLFGAPQVMLSAELAAEYIPTLPDSSDIRFRRHTNFGVAPDDSEKGYVTDFTWGYRLSARTTYRDLLGPVSLSPSVVFTHGVKGYASDDALQENQRTMAVNLEFGYKQAHVKLGYVRFSDSRYSVWRDRDHVNLSTGIQF
ncbi:DUF1302 domain-containing protein [Isoalcanivorax beigongshangi]|uniref:DUF1302 domain-containing protein n=1 Tax=Isoalcanivorax beigongshangi TaxID=3238810 RepID=A0ABV4AH38_9GAMM